MVYIEVRQQKLCSILQEADPKINVKSTQYLINYTIKLLSQTFKVSK